MILKESAIIFGLLITGLGGCGEKKDSFPNTNCQTTFKEVYDYLDENHGGVKAGGTSRDFNGDGVGDLFIEAVDGTTYYKYCYDCADKAYECWKRVE